MVWWILLMNSVNICLTFQCKFMIIKQIPVILRENMSRNVLSNLVIFNMSLQLHASELFLNHECTCTISSEGLWWDRLISWDGFVLFSFHIKDIQSHISYLSFSRHRHPHPLPPKEVESRRVWVYTCFLSKTRLRYCLLWAKRALTPILQHEDDILLILNRQTR